MRVRKGTFLGEYCGELIDLPEAARRVHEHYERTQNYYFVDYNTWAGELLDAGLRGNKIRFVNHSVRWRTLTQCEPNCKMEKWLVSGSEQDHTAEFQLGLFALRDIEAGEELSYNYGWSAFRPIDVASGEEGEAYTPMRCFCGAPSCTGWLGRARKTPQSSRPPSPVAALPSATPVPPQTALRAAKRPRGRPRKDAHAHADAAAAEAPPAAAPSASLPGAPDAATETPRRKRGRPRKHPHSETAPPDASVARIDARAYADQPRVRRTAEAYAAALARQSATTQPKRASAEPRAARGAHAATVDEPRTEAGGARAAEVGAAVEAAEAAEVAPSAEVSAPVEAAPPAEAAASVEAAEAATPTEATTPAEAAAPAAAPHTDRPDVAAATESAVPTEPAPPKRRRGRPSKTSAPLSTATPARAQVLDTVAPEVPASDGEERRDAPLHTPLRRKRGRPSKSEVATPVADRPMEPDGLADASVADAGVAETDAMDVDMADASAADAGGLDARAAEMGVAAEATSERAASPGTASERVAAEAASERAASPVASPLKRKRGRPRKSAVPGTVPPEPAAAPLEPAAAPSPGRGTPTPAEPLAMPVGVYFTLTPTQIAHISAQPHRRRGRPRVHPVFPRASPPRWRRPPPESDEAAVRALLL